MSCSVAIASSSPVAFSPSRLPLSCKTSPETLSLTAHLYQSDGSPSGASCGTSSPFRHRFQRPGSVLRPFSSPPPSIGVDSSGSPSGLMAESGGKVSALKRKRPARIDIPMGDVLCFGEPKKSDGRKEVEEEGERYSVYCKRGRKRLEMEDRFRAHVDPLGDSELAFFGIFDGHGGTNASEFASKNLGEHIIEEVRTRADECEIEEAVRFGYLKTDAEFLKEDAGGGTCCVTALLRNGNLVVSNAGDCRAVLSRNGMAEALTSDHRPSRKDERDRIESFGGYVECCRGTWRLQGSLAVSRGIGDAHLKQWVIPEPETSTVSIKPECEFLILASDGLWDKVSNQEAVDIARPLCIDNADKQPSLLSACKKLADLSVTRGSLDDVSVMIIQLKNYARND
ncbi:Protein-serine/threonine phosphatase protein [Dioscorea alata]|uniref:Protein-serine/threonine phosphatase protein n=1 Tax=Dioscorea alata TaxID=55571 RepID=A0ACB7VTD1_DIOAL|nr:Protein-serine/threonine phosphatase protein [Dioscorea alata]